MLPIVVLMIFGIVEIGFLFRSATIVSTSSRSGARLAAAQYGAASTSAAQNNVMDNVRLTVEKDLTSRASDDTPVVLWIYKADANGNPPSGGFTTCGSPCYVVHVERRHGALHAVEWQRGPPPVACGTAHDSVGVYVKATHTPIGFTSTFGTFNINERTVMRLEPSQLLPERNMTMNLVRRGQGHARCSGDSGAVLVEAAFIFPVVFFISMAILEYGMLFAAQSTTQSSTRDGARFASANFAVAGSNQAAADEVKDAVSAGPERSHRLRQADPDARVQGRRQRQPRSGDPRELQRQLLPLHVGRHAVRVRRRVAGVDGPPGLHQQPEPDRQPRCVRGAPAQLHHERVRLVAGPEGAHRHPPRAPPVDPVQLGASMKSTDECIDPEERESHRVCTDDGGFALTWFAILLLVLIAMAGFGVDVWNWWYTSQKVQRAADAGALRA